MIMQNLGVTNKKHYGMLWYQFFFGKEDDEPEKMIMATKSAVDNGELYKCLPCDWLYTVRRKEVRV